MIADHLAKRVRAKKSRAGSQRVEVWHRRDGQFRVIEVRRGGQPERWRETRGETKDDEPSAVALAKSWEDADG